MLLHINALTLFYYKIVLAVVPYKLKFSRVFTILVYSSFKAFLILLSDSGAIPKYVAT